MAIDVVLKCRIICPTGNRWNRALFTSQKKQLWLPLKLDSSRIAHEICQGQSLTFGSYCSRCHPNRFTFGGVIAERMKAVLLPHHKQRSSAALL